jgi:hypothetical protein
MDPIPDDGKKGSAKANRNWILLGVLGWGLTVFLITTAWDFHDFPGLLRSGPYSLLKLFFRLAVFLVLGYLLGLRMSRGTRRRIPPS